MRIIQTANLLLLAIYVFSALTIGTALILSSSSQAVYDSIEPSAVTADQPRDDVAYTVLAQNAP